MAAAIHNNGKADAHQASIVCVLLADGRQIDAREFRADVKAGDVYIARWSVATPAAHACAWKSPSASITIPTAVTIARHWILICQPTSRRRGQGGQCRALP